MVLGIFIIEIILHLSSYGKLYLRDPWNIADIVVILISVAFVLTDLIVTIKNNNNTSSSNNSNTTSTTTTTNTTNSGSAILKGVLKIRGIFRLLRVLILVRKLSIVKMKRDIRKRIITISGYDLRSPLERVLEILNDIRDSIDPNEERMISEMNYCIKQISSNKLYEAEIDIEEPDEDNSGPAGSPNSLKKKTATHKDGL